MSGQYDFIQLVCAPVFQEVQLILLVAVENVLNRKYRIELELLISKVLFQLRKKHHQCFEDVEAEFGLRYEVVVHRYISTRLNGILNDISVLRLPQQLTDALHDFMGHQPLLNLREFENDRNQASNVPLRGQRDITAELEAVEGDVD